MSAILKNTGIKVWAQSDYAEYFIRVFEELTGDNASSNMQLIDKAIGELQKHNLTAYTGESVSTYDDLPTTGEEYVFYLVATDTEDYSAGLYRWDGEKYVTIGGSDIKDNEESTESVWSSSKVSAELKAVKIYHVGDTAPENTNLLWIDTSDNNVAKYYDGTDWIPLVTNAIYATE